MLDTAHDNSPRSLLLLFGSQFVLGLGYVGFIRSSLRAADGGEAKVFIPPSDWRGPALFSLAFASIFTLGMILWVLPGLIAAIAFVFSFWAIADEDASVPQAFRKGITVLKRAPFKIGAFFALPMLPDAALYAALGMTGLRGSFVEFATKVALFVVLYPVCTHAGTYIYRGLASPAGVDEGAAA